MEHIEPRQNTGTHWFWMSNRELAALVAAAVMALLTVGAVRGVRWLWGRGTVTVTSPGHVLPIPARLNVNTAAEHDLAILPGIGPKTAAAIVQYRTEHGPFRDWDDLMQVRGIGPATVERIRPHAMCGLVK